MPCLAWIIWSAYIIKMQLMGSIIKYSLRTDVRDFT